MKKGNDKPKNGRIKFEPSDSKKCIVENEFCKIYLDSVSHQTFKVINDYVVPIELREFNMWKNRQKDASGFSVEIIKDDSGEVFDYVITKGTGTAPKKAETAAPSAAAVPPTAAPVQTQTSPQAAAAVIPSKPAPAQMAPAAPDIKKSDSAPRKRKPKSTRLSKCAICKNEFKDEDLLLFVNRNYCFGCVEEAVKEKVQGFPVDPVEKAILDITTADELYCTYSTTTNYPYIDDNGCVNVCSISRAAESVVDNTAVETIEDKGVFFDDLKRYGMRRIIVNNDSTHIFTPDDFDEHVKSDGVVAPKVYFDIIKYTQTDDLGLREKIAAKFLNSTFYTLSMNDDITEITEDNIDIFKPLTLTDGTAVICPVFTDIVEAKSVNLSFKGLYSINAALLPEDGGITHYIINPGSIGYIINKNFLVGVEPYAGENDTEELPVQDNFDEVSANPEENASVSDEPATEEISAEPIVEEAVIVEEINDEPSIVGTAATGEISAEPIVEEAVSVEEINAEPSIEETAAAEEIPAEPIVEEAVIVEEINAEPLIEETAAAGEISVEPIVEEAVIVEESPVKQGERTVSYMPEDTVPIEDNHSKLVSDQVIEQAVTETVNEQNLDELVQELDAENDDGTTLELSGLIYDPILTEEKMPVRTIQDHIVETNAILNDLQNTTDFGNAASLRRKLDESLKELANMIVNANTVYAQFDSTTKHIFIDSNNRGHIFSDNAIAEKSNDNYRSQGIDLYCQKFPKESILTMVYEFKRHGIQDLVVDESSNRITIPTDTIFDSLNVDDPELVKIPITNPELMFSMTTLFQKLNSKTDSPTRKTELASLERRMIREFTSSRYILPLLSADGEEARPITLENKSGSCRILIFSDVYEMKRFFGERMDIVKDYRILSYKDMVENYAKIPNTVVVLNEGSLRFEFSPHNCEHISRVSNA